MGFRKKATQTAKYFQHQSQHKHHLELSRRSVFMAFILSFIIFSCTHTSSSNFPSVDESLTTSGAIRIWCDKGFTVEEDEALQQVVSNWEKQTGNKIKISFYTNDELPQKTERAMKAGNPPDVMIGYSAETELNPRLAWEGKLADVSDVIESVKSFYPETVLQAIHFYNNVDKKRSYYAIPIHQGTIHIFYWRDLLKQVGKTESDIPKDWNGFWEFWKQVQDKLRSQKKQNLYGLGFPYSIGAADTYYTFEQILEAYDIQIVNSKGQLLLNEPKVRQGIIDSLEWYAKFYQQGYVPPDAINWFNPDNNRQLLNRTVVMTPNATLSIPAAVRQDFNTYRNKLGILEYPNKPNGKSMRYLILLKEAVVFAVSENQKTAKEFLTYFIQPKVMGDYLKAIGGRNLPVHQLIWKDPFWKNPKDPHVLSAAKVLTQRQTRPYYYVQHPAYSVVLDENVWGKALNRIIGDRISPQQAADEAIERIKQIFEQWQ